MALEKILNPYVIDNVAAFGIGFTSGLRHSKYDRYSGKYSEKGAKRINDFKAFKSTAYGAIPAVLDFMIRGLPNEDTRMLAATGMASSLLGFESGKLFGYFLHRNNAKLNTTEEEALNKNLSDLKRSVHSDNFKDFRSSLMKCTDYMSWLDNKKGGNRKIREIMGEQFNNTMNYCTLYKEIEQNNSKPELRTIVIDVTKNPKAHALIVGRNSITDLSIHFDHYRLTEVDNFPMGVGMVQAKPRLSRQEIEWDGDVDKVINIIDSYKKENTVMVITGGHDECPAKKELDASKEFTMLYTNYLGMRQFVESHKDFLEKTKGL